MDLDDTLSDHIHSCKAGLGGLQGLYEPLRQKSVDALEAEFVVLLDRMHPDVLAGVMTLHEARMERLRLIFAGCGLSLPEEELERAAAVYQAFYMEARQATDGAHELLDWLKEQGVKIAVLTNGLQTVQEGKLRECRLEPYVDLLLTSEEAGVTKPHRAIFDLALEWLGLDARDVIMVGDSWSADILGAQAAGLRAFWLNRRLTECPDPRLATEIRGLRELIHRLKRTKGV